MTTWVVVLIKDFASAKQRLRPALGTKSRRALARQNAHLAVTAASAGDRVLVVAGSKEVATLAESWGADVVTEPHQDGQNVAAARGIERAAAGGAGAVVILSSDLPLVTQRSVKQLIDFGAQFEPPAVVAVPAIGRGGTNSLYVRPPDAIGLHFGNDSLTRFQEDADDRGVSFAIHHSDAMALDLDEPSDLERFSRAV
jgi:2-phospho-L-lactate guanylyltransferase